MYLLRNQCCTCSLILPMAILVALLGIADQGLAQNTTPIAYGSVIEGKISLPGEADAFGSAGFTGSMVAIQLGCNGFYPYLELYDWTGALVVEASGSHSQAARINATLPTTGGYTIVVRDKYGVYTGPYGLTLTSVSTTSERQASLNLPQ